MNVFAEAFIRAGVVAPQVAAVESVTTAEPFKVRSVISREVVIDGRGSYIAVNSANGRWDPEKKLILVGRHVQAGAGEFVNFVFTGAKESLIGVVLKGSFVVNRLTFDDAAVFYEVIITVQKNPIGDKVRLVIGPKKYNETDIELACGGFISIV